MKEMFVCANGGYELSRIVVPDRYAGLAPRANRSETTTVGARCSARGYHARATTARVMSNVSG